MNSISAPAEPVYRTCYAYHSATGKMEFQTYNFTEMLEKMKNSTPPEGCAYWKPDEYGRVYIDPNHPMYAALESAEPPDYSDVQLPAPGSVALPSESRTEDRTKKAEEQKDKEERLRLFREERERMARQEALFHRLSMAILSARR